MTDEFDISFFKVQGKRTVKQVEVEGGDKILIIQGGAKRTHDFKTTIIIFMI